MPFVGVDMLLLLLPFPLVLVLVLVLESSDARRASVAGPAAECCLISALVAEEPGLIALKAQMMSVVLEVVASEGRVKVKEVEEELENDWEVMREARRAGFATTGLS